MGHQDTPLHFSREGLKSDRYYCIRTAQHFSLKTTLRGPGIRSDCAEEEAKVMGQAVVFTRYQGRGPGSTQVSYWTFDTCLKLFIVIFLL